MLAFWTDAVAEGWLVFADVAGGLLPVIGLAIGLGIVGVVVGYFTGRS